MEAKVFTKDMGEISGFGGSYEAGCRAMFLAGVKWLDEHPNAHPITKEFSNIFGVIHPENEDARALEKAFLNATVEIEPGRIVRCGDECTGAMIHAVFHHLSYYRLNGWNAYCAKMRVNK